jgi:cytochrome P450
VIMRAAAVDVSVAELERDPYPTYARLRREAPVAFVPSVGLWFVTRWQDVVRAAEDPIRFPAALPGSPLDRTLGGVNVLTVDGDDHRLLRAPMEATLRPHRVMQTAPGVVEPIAHRLVDAFANDGRAELMGEYCEPLAVLSLARVIGLSEALDADTLRRWFHDLATGTSNYENDPDKQVRADAVGREIDDVLRPHLARLLDEPDGSMVSDMLHGQRGDLGERMAGFMPTLKLALIGGLQEPAHGLGSTIVGLLERPPQLDAIRADPGRLIRRAVEEGIRWVSPIGTEGRVAGADATLSGTTIPPGDAVALIVPSANRDEHVWGDDADVFDLERGRHANAAFGFGPHFCVGHQLARFQMRIGLRVLLERLSGLRLTAERPVEFRGWEYRGPAELPVRWEAA